MPLYTYTARNPAGRPQRGIQEAPSAPALVSLLRGRGWLVMDVRAADTNSRSLRDWLALLNPFSWLPPRSAHVELALQQITIMLRGGLTLLASLKTVAEYARHQGLRRIWTEVADKIQRGSSLADAMAEYRCFSHMVVQLVRVGEQTGTLEQVLTRAAAALERRRLLRTQLLTVLFYPTIVFFAAIGVAAFMIIYLIPKLKVFLSAMGRKLPPMTQRLLDISDFTQAYGIYFVIGFLALTAVFIGLYLWPTGRLWIDRIALRTPLFGFMLRLTATVQFAHGLSVLLNSGITLVEGLRTVEQLHGNRWAAARVAEARSSVLRGGNLTEPLAAPGVYMPMLSRMVAVAESAGTLDEVLMEVARFHESQLQGTIRLFSAIIEPVIVVVVGSIVGFVYISFFMALFAAAGSAK